ncbi:cellulose binding domain-containing protein [Micromonospora sp. WMMC250]|uniref:cellulose binding domain-containing protein n=1 Tax=Micromonospora sp. WMMC250 TaxID=3014781 RepID=UPI0022B74977|nr:cellulose binding domain-containing protein [Micromonospora sp. WMMC250]MCZ7379566.1 cellulose binding domain-containing protein [Micromonospora sp. WMMC250]
MAVRPDGAAGSRAARMLASVPWIVVLLGVCALVVLLVVALLSFRTRERESVPQGAPPVFVPTVPAAESATGGPTPAGVERRSVSPRPSRSSRTPSPRATVTSSPTPGRTAAPLVSTPSGGATVTARYQVGSNGWDGDAAVLSIANETSRSVDWSVELTFDDDLWALRVSDDSGVSMRGRGNGEFVLWGTRSLEPGASRTVRLRVGWGESAQRPQRCTINGVDCRLG